MKGKRKHTAAFKAQVALATLKADKTVNELASQYGVHPTLIHAWKKQLLVGADQVFGNGRRAADAEAQKAELFEQIGRLKMELEWLKKSRAARLSGCGRSSIPAQERPSCETMSWRCSRMTAGPMPRSSTPAAS
jgi:putative transposase